MYRRQASSTSRGAGSSPASAAGIFERTTITAAGDVLKVNESGNVVGDRRGGIGIDTTLGRGQAGNIVITTNGGVGGKQRGERQCDQCHADRHGNRATSM